MVQRRKIPNYGLNQVRDFNTSFVIVSPRHCRSGTVKKEEAADLFVRAANAYKVGKRYKGEWKYLYKILFWWWGSWPLCSSIQSMIVWLHAAAGAAFRRAAQIHIELDVKHEAASTLVEAGQVLKKDDATGTGGLVLL